MKMAQGLSGYGAADPYLNKAGFILDGSKYNTANIGMSHQLPIL